VPVGVQGVDLFEPQTERDGVVIEEDELGIHMGELGPTRLTTFVDERWRLTLWHGDPQGELFDRESDPHELRNLWNDPGAARVKAGLMERLLRERLALVDVLPLARRSA
jgi:hypothetical protein